MAHAHIYIHSYVHTYNTYTHIHIRNLHTYLREGQQLVEGVEELVLHGAFPHIHTLIRTHI
jgi:hypothetical protein